MGMTRGLSVIRSALSSLARESATEMDEELLWGKSLLSGNPSNSVT
jgi:hypothetical protein